MRFHSAAEAWTEVFQMYEVGSVFGMEGVARASQGPTRPFCPQCRQYNVLREVTEPTKEQKEAGIKYVCRSCDSKVKRPLWLRRKGSLKFSDDRGGRNNNDRIADALVAGKIFAAIDSLEIAFKSWGMWVYTSVGTKADRDGWESDVMEWLIDELDNREIALPRSWDELKGVQQLMLFAMHDYKNVCITGKRLYGAKRLAKEIGVYHSQFSPQRYWGNRYVTMFDALKSLNNMALSPINALIDEEEHREEHGSLAWLKCSTRNNA